VITLPCLKWAALQITVTTKHHATNVMLIRHQFFLDESLQNGMIFLSNSDVYYNFFCSKFPPQMSEDHCQNCFKECSLETDEECDDFFKKHGI
jgi:hypothetical protein